MLARRNVTSQSVRSSDAAVHGRRAALFTLLGVGGLMAVPTAQARDFKKAQQEKQARKESFRSQAAVIKETKVDTLPVYESEYELAEQARMANVDTRQEETVRKQ